MDDARLPAASTADAGHAAPPPGPLAGLRVIDLATMVAGPTVATLLGDFGADVLKVELPGRGDTLRTVGPVSENGDTSYWWAADARNKRGMTLDLRKPRGKELLLRLVAVSDVLVENFVPGTLEEWELAPERLQRANPRLVVVRVSGFGQTGPYRKRPGYDRIGAAFSGLWYLTAHPGHEPVRPGLSVVDYMTGMFATIGALIALYVRDATGSGRGQVIDAALFESVMRAWEFTATHYSATGVVRAPVGNSGAAQPAGAYRTRDGRWTMIAVAEERMFRRLMQAIDAPELAEDPRFRTNAARVQHEQELHTVIRDWIAAHDLATVMDRLQGADIPMSASYTVEDLFRDPHVAARDDLVTVEDPALGPVTMQGIVPKLSDTPGAVYRPAPLLGHDNDAVYGDLLGLSALEIAALRAEQVV